VSTGKKPLAASYAEYSYLALVLPVSTFVGYLAGHYLDRWLGTHWLTILFLILGTVGGFVELIHQILSDTKDRDGG